MWGNQILSKAGIHFLASIGVTPLMKTSVRVISVSHSIAIGLFPMHKFFFILQNPSLMNSFTYMSREFTYMNSFTYMSLK